MGFIKLQSIFLLYEEQKSYSSLLKVEMSLVCDPEASGKHQKMWWRIIKPLVSYKL